MSSRSPNRSAPSSQPTERRVPRLKCYAQSICANLSDLLDRDGAGADLTVAVTLWLTDQRMQHLMARQDELAHEASTVLAAQGVPGLRDWLRHEITAGTVHDRLYIIDQRGVDLLARPVPNYLQMQVGHRPYPVNLNGTCLSTTCALLSQLVSATNQTYALSLLHRWNLFGVFGVFGSTETPIVTLIATLLASAIVCFLLARYLSDPIRHLRAATRSLMRRRRLARTGFRA